MSGYVNENQNDSWYRENEMKHAKSDTTKSKKKMMVKIKRKQNKMVSFSKQTLARIHAKWVV